MQIKSKQTPNNFIERLELALALRGLKMASLVKGLSIAHSTTTRWRNGAVPHFATLNNIADFLRINRAWLRSGEGDMDLTEEDLALAEARMAGGQSVAEAARTFPSSPAESVVAHQLQEDAAPYMARPANAIPVRWVPVISWAHAGTATSYEELPKHWQESIPVPDFKGEAFALRVQGDSMEPRCLEGDCVLVLPPPAEPHSGNLVVAKLKTDGIVLRRYTALGNSRVKLTPYNTMYDATEHDVGDFHWIYPVHSTIRTER